MSSKYIEGTLLTGRKGLLNQYHIDMSEIDELERKLKQLQKQKKDVLLRNQKALLADKKQNSGQRVHGVVDTEESIKSQNKRYQLGNLSESAINYSIREYEEWETRTHHSRNNRAVMGDFQSIAKNSYKKEVQNLPKGTAHELQGTITEKGTVVVEDNPELIDNIAKSLNEQAKKRYMVRKQKLEKQNKVDINDGFVNDSNKRFNLKLKDELNK